jgi:hypothetical protein
MPVRALGWGFGAGSFSQDWRDFQSSNRAYYAEGERWMQRVLPGDVNHELYRVSRNVASHSLEAGSVFMGGAAIAKGILNVGARGLARLSGQMTKATLKQELRFKGAKWRFPENPADLLKELPRDRKGRIYANNNLRIRPEKHHLKSGDIFNPRHHGQHYHIEMRRNINQSWGNYDNIEILKPFNYQPGQGTGFLPGELFPGIK